MNPPDSLNSAFLLRLFASSPEPSARTAHLVSKTLDRCQKSRHQCQHLLPFFEDSLREPPTLNELFLADSRWQAHLHWNELEPLLAEPRTMLRKAMTLPTACRWGLTETFCETSRQFASKNRGLSLHLARSAVLLARSAPLDPMSKDARAELLALAHATFANALRAWDRTHLARRAMNRALGYLAEQNTHPLNLTSLILSLNATLQIWERRYISAHATLSRALDKCPQSNSVLMARLLIQRSSLVIYEEDYGSAVQDLDVALGLLNSDDQPLLWSGAILNRLLIATQLHQWQEVEDLLPGVRRRLSQLGEEVNLIRLGWCEARLAMGQDQQAKAETIYLRVRDGFLRRQLGYHAALVTIELAHLLFEQGRLEQVKQYALETAAEFKRQGVEPELVGALALLEKAVTAQRLTVQLLERIRRSVERRNRP